MFRHRKLDQSSQMGHDWPSLVYLCLFYFGTIPQSSSSSRPLLLPCLTRPCNIDTRYITFPRTHLHSSQTSQAALLNLGQRPASTHEGNQSHDSRRWQSLEEVPAGVVHEKYALHGQDGAIEKPVRHRCIAQSFAYMTGIRAQRCPYTQQYR
jgi:hypothetical protein